MNIFVVKSPFSPVNMQVRIGASRSRSFDILDNANIIEVFTCLIGMFRNPDNTLSGIHFDAHSQWFLMNFLKIAYKDYK